MAAVRSDRFDAPSGVHDERVLAWTRSVADDSLAGRTIWCAAALPVGRAAASRLLGLLRGPCGPTCRWAPAPAVCGGGGGPAALPGHPRGGGVTRGGGRGGAGGGFSGARGGRRCVPPGGRPRPEAPPATAPADPDQCKKL